MCARPSVLALGCLAALAMASPGGAACTFAPDPPSLTFLPSGGSGRVIVLVDEGCAWTATSNRPAFLRITAGARGEGPGAVELTVAPNRRSARRQGVLRIAGGAVTVLQSAAFDDVPPESEFYREIGKLSARGVTLGCGGGSYCPNQSVPRDQMAAFIIRALGDFNPPPPAMQRFLDVPPTNPFYAFIEQMAVRQITLGCGGGNYCPDQSVPREQMAAFIIRALGEFNPPPPAMQRFVDVPPTNPFYAFVEELAVRGAVPACGCDAYCPSAPVTNDEAAAFLIRAFRL